MKGLEENVMSTVLMPQSEMEASKHADPYQLQSIDRVVALLDMRSEERRVGKECLE